MNRLWSGSCCWACSILLIAFAAMAARQAAAAEPGNDGGSAQTVSIAEYRAHLESLETLVAACQKQRTAEACNPAQAGTDDKVQLTAGSGLQARDVRYGWLRDLLDRAGKKEDGAVANGGPGVATKEPLPMIDALLSQARQRLSDDWKEASQAVESSPRYDSERRALQAILARKEYKGVVDRSARERFLEWLSSALDKAFSALAQFGSHAPWIATTLRVLLLGGICIGLVWALIRIERQSRIQLEFEPVTVTGAPSAREWQLWLADARTMAEQDLWREAIHYLYWAAIARLESRGLWPADRARTPREYLGLLSPSDARKSNLTMLTRSFERTWYGGRDADSSDYDAALKMAAELGVE